jgi:hypothetical protein
MPQLDAALGAYAEVPARKNCSVDRIRHADHAKVATIVGGSVWNVPCPSGGARHGRIKPFVPAHIEDIVELVHFPGKLEVLLYYRRGDAKRMAGAHLVELSVNAIAVLSRSFFSAVQSLFAKAKEGVQLVLCRHI